MFSFLATFQSSARNLRLTALLLRGRNDLWHVQFFNRLNIINSSVSTLITKFLNIIAFPKSSFGSQLFL